ncbi:hypothetical protein HYX02_03330 [Candidatus Woesearchaeota archaeon]|nr:hypothetical protein [Candidatus Woesearchaeota archaeon]
MDRKQKKEFQKKLNKIGWLIVIVPLLFVWYSIRQGKPPLLIGLLLMSPGVYFLIYSLYFKELQVGNYRGFNAIIMGFSYFLLFSTFGIPFILIHFGIYLRYSDWYFPIALVIALFLPRIIISISDWINKDSNYVVEYWTQFHNFDVKDGDEVNYDDAMKLIDNFEWDRELPKKRQREKDGKEGCPPGIGFTYKNNLFDVMGVDKDIFQIYVELSEPRQLFGFIPFPKTRKIESKDIDRKNVDLLLKYFFEKRYADIIKSISK